MMYSHCLVINDFARDRLQYQDINRTRRYYSIKSSRSAMYDLLLVGGDREGGSTEETHSEQEGAVHRGREHERYSREQFKGGGSSVQGRKEQCTGGREHCTGGGSREH